MKNDENGRDSKKIGGKEDFRASKNPTERIAGKSDLSGFQVLRKEYSSHKFDAAITLSREMITFNTACIRFYMDTNYVQVLIDEKKRRIAIRKCNQYDRDAMQWARIQKKDGKRVSRAIKAVTAMARLFELMSWNQANRYHILGTRKIYDNTDLVLFFLEDAEIFVSEESTDAEGKVIRKTRNFLPYQWRDSFGDFVEEHDRKQAIDLHATLRLFNTPDGQAYFLEEKGKPQKSE